MKKQQVFPPSQAPSHVGSHLYGTSTAPHTCAAHTRTHTHTHTHAVHKQGGCVYHTHTKKACCVQDIYIFAGLAPGPGPGGITQSYKMNNVCSSSMYFFNVMVHLQTARGTCMYVHLVIAERSEANNRAVCDLGWRMYIYIYICIYIYIYIYLQVWPRAPGEPPSTVRGSAR